MKHKALTKDDKNNIIERISKGEHMAYIAKEMGMDKGNLSRSLQSHNKTAYRQAVISKMQLLEQQAAYNLAYVETDQDRRKWLKEANRCRRKLSKYDPDNFPYHIIKRHLRQVKPEWDKSAM